MARYFGKVGFVMQVEKDPINHPGVFTASSIEKDYSGDILRDNISWQSKQNFATEDIRYSNRISILSDPFAIENTRLMKYVEIRGALWKIESVDIDPDNPRRLIINVGGEYNGEQAESA